MQRCYASRQPVTKRIRAMTAMSDIQFFAWNYVLDHPELIAEAKVICQQLHQQEFPGQRGDAR